MEDNTNIYSLESLGHWDRNWLVPGCTLRYFGGVLCRQRETFIWIGPTPRVLPNIEHILRNSYPLCRLLKRCRRISGIPYTLTSNVP